MIQPKTILRRLLVAIVVMIQIVAYPAVGWADDGTPSSDGAGSTTTSTTTDPSTDPTQSTTTTDPAPVPPTPPTPETPNTETPPADDRGPQTPAGPTSPTGPDGQTYQYNPATGLWENDYYYWNAATQQYAPKSNPNLVYDTASGTWQTTQWRFDAPTGNYVPQVTPAAAPNTSRLSVGTLGTGAQSNNGISQLNNLNGSFNSNTSMSVTNLITQGAYTGDVSLGQNTLAGNARSGNANDTANIINMLQSSWGPTGGDYNVFSANLYGDMTGDLFIDPSALAGSGANLNVDKQTNANVDVNIANDGEIVNNVNLKAQSGNVDVNGNSQAGDAESGAAHAVGNIVNMMNSSIAAGQSFIGNINIYGNLDGDILIPPDILQQLIANNGPQANVDVSQIENTNILADLSDTTSIVNNTDLSAASGSVTSNANTQAGDATSGKAETNLTVLNLTGKQVVGKDALLVFVNVLGKWVGVLMNAPAGATAGAFGDTNVNNTTNLNATLAAKNTGKITNNVAIDAQSGDVNASNNTKVGNARSGNASASLNLLNISSSELSLSNWLGVLFINVFGTWNGSFGVNTDAGNKPTSTPTTQSAAPATTQAKVFRFVPTANNKFQLEPVTGSTDDTTPTSGPQVLTASKVIGTGHTNNNTSTPTFSTSSRDWTLPIIGLFSGAALLGFERALAFRQRHLA